MQRREEAAVGAWDGHLGRGSPPPPPRGHLVMVEVPCLHFAAGGDDEPRAVAKGQALDRTVQPDRAADRGRSRRDPEANRAVVLPARQAPASRMERDPRGGPARHHDLRRAVEHVEVPQADDPARGSGGEDLAGRRDVKAGHRRPLRRQHGDAGTLRVPDVQPAVPCPRDDGSSVASEGDGRDC